MFVSKVFRLSCFFPTVSVVVVRFSSVTFLSFLPRLPPWLSTHAVQLTAPIGDNGQLMSGASGGPPVLWLSTNAVQMAVPQLMSDGSCGPPVLWLSTNAVQLTVPIGDDGQLMSGASGGRPVL